MVLNTGEATHTQGGLLNVTFESGDLIPNATWQVHTTLTNDHYTTLTTLAVAPLIPPRPPPRWDIRRAGWVRFQAVLDEWWAAYEPPGDLHQQERELTAAIQRAADAAIPKCPLGRRRPERWFYCKEVREHTHLVMAIRVAAPACH